MGSLRYCSGLFWRLFNFSLLVSLWSGPAVFAQTDHRLYQGDLRYTEQQLRELQEFALQYRQESTAFQSTEELEPVPNHYHAARPRRPAQNVGFSRSYQDQDDDPFDPFRDLRGRQDQSPTQEPDFDPSPDPPVDENGFRRPEFPARDPDADPFSDDRAIQNLKDLQQRLPQETEPRQSRPRNGQSRETPQVRAARPETRPRLPETTADEEALRQWEDPYGNLIPESRANNYQRPNGHEAQPGQPQTRLAPQPYQGNLQHEQWQPPPQQGEFQPGHNPYYNHPHGHSGYPQPYQPNPYQIHDPLAYGGYEPDGYPGDQLQRYPQQAGQGSFFANQHRGNQWGVAGLDNMSGGPNSCRSTDCGFDCDAPIFYLAAYGAAVDLRDLVSDNNTLLADNGGGFGVALGQRQGRNLRTELEYGWRSNGIVGLEPAMGFDAVTGTIKSQAGMANAYWEFVNFPHCRLKPYVGTGLGFVRLDSELIYREGNSLTLARSEDSSFAYQFIGGVNLKKNNNLDLFIEYRLFRADSFNLDTSAGMGDGRYDYQTNNLLGGLRWKF